VKYQVNVSQAATEKVAARYGTTRTLDGKPSEFDFWAGLLAVALLGFQEFDKHRLQQQPRVGWLHTFDSTFGPVSFVAVLVKPSVVEIADFDDDSDYWEFIANDPTD